MKLDILLRNIEGGLLPSLKKLHSDSPELQKLIEKIIALIESNRDFEGKNSYRFAKKILNQQKPIFLDLITRGRLKTIRDLFNTFTFPNKETIEPPHFFIRYLADSHADHKNLVARYEFTAGTLFIDDRCDGKTSFEQLVMVHELIHLHQFSDLLSKLPPGEKSALREKLEKPQKNTQIIDWEAQAHGGSLKIIDLMSEGLLREIHSFRARPGPNLKASRRVLDFERDMNKWLEPVRKAFYNFLEFFDIEKAFPLSLLTFEDWLKKKAIGTGIIYRTSEEVFGTESRK